MQALEDELDGGRDLAGAGRAVAVPEPVEHLGQPRHGADLVQQLTDQMMQAARDLQFELAARLRDEIADLKKELRGMDAAGLQ